MKESGSIVHHFNDPSTPAFEPFDCFLGHRREEVDEVAVGVAKQCRAVPPWHRGRFLYPLVDKRLQARVLGIDVVDAKFDDDGVVVGRAHGTSAEQLHRLGVADRQRTRWQNELSEDRRGTLRRNACDLFIEHDESIQIVGNDAYRSEIHEITTFQYGIYATIPYRIILAWKVQVTA